MKHLFPFFFLLVLCLGAQAQDKQMDDTQSHLRNTLNNNKKQKSRAERVHDFKQNLKDFNEGRGDYSKYTENPSQDLYNKSEVEYKDISNNTNNIYKYSTEITDPNKAFKDAEKKYNDENREPITSSTIVVTLGILSVAFVLFFLKRRRNIIKDSKERLSNQKKELESLRKYVGQTEALAEFINDNKKTAEIIAEVKEMVEETKKTKPEAQYTANDWFLKACATVFFARNKQKESKPKEAIINFEEACLYYRKATEIKPDYAVVYNNWGAALRDLAELKSDERIYVEASEKFKKATELKPDYASAYNNWGLTLGNLAKIKDVENT